MAALTALTDREISVAVSKKQLAKLAGHVAHSAVCSAHENNAADAEYEAVERLDDWSRIWDICGCEDLRDMDDNSLRSIAKLAIAKIKA